MNTSEPSPICDAVPLREGERIDDLQLNGLRIIQKSGAFRFGTDAVLLADFARLPLRARVIDFGTGTGAIALLMAGHHPDITVDAVEIQPDMAEMAARSVRLNDLVERVRVHEMDIRCAPQRLGYNTFDAVVCNPPYYDAASAPPKGENRQISRTQTQISLDDICQSAVKCLKSGGRLAMVYPAARLFELMNAMQRVSIAPKRIRTVHALPSRAPKLALLDGVKQGGAQLEWLPPLMIKNEDGTFTEEWIKKGL